MSSAGDSGVDNSNDSRREQAPRDGDTPRERGLWAALMLFTPERLKPWLRPLAAVAGILGAGAALTQMFAPSQGLGALGGGIVVAVALVVGTALLVANYAPPRSDLPTTPSA